MLVENTGCIQFCDETSIKSRPAIADMTNVEDTATILYSKGCEMDVGIKREEGGGAVVKVGEEKTDT